MKTAHHWAPKYLNLTIKQPLISDWCKNEAKWREEWETCNGVAGHSAKHAWQTLHPQVTEMMDLWIVKAMHDKILLTGDVLHAKWNTFTNLCSIPKDEQLSLSDGWLARVKNWHGLKQFKRHEEAGSASKETVESKHECVKELLAKKGYTQKNTFNMDETGLFYA